MRLLIGALSRSNFYLHWCGFTLIVLLIENRSSRAGLHSLGGYCQLHDNHKQMVCTADVLPVQLNILQSTPWRCTRASKNHVSRRSYQWDRCRKGCELCNWWENIYTICDVQIIRRGKACLDMLNMKLGERKFFYGDKYVAFVLFVLFDFEIKTLLVRRTSVWRVGGLASCTIRQRQATTTHETRVLKFDSLRWNDFVNLHAAWWKRCVESVTIKPLNVFFTEHRRMRLSMEEEWMPIVERAQQQLELERQHNAQASARSGTGKVRSITTETSMALYCCRRKTTTSHTAGVRRSYLVRRHLFCLCWRLCILALYA